MYVYAKLGKKINQKPYVLSCPVLSYAIHSFSDVCHILCIGTYILIWPVEATAQCIFENCWLFSTVFGFVCLSNKMEILVFDRCRKGYSIIISLCARTMNKNLYTPHTHIVIWCYALQAKA
jgi:hypothetical protein